MMCRNGLHHIQKYSEHFASFMDENVKDKTSVTPLSIMWISLPQGVLQILYR